MGQVEDLILGLETLEELEETLDLLILYHLIQDMCSTSTNTTSHRYNTIILILNQSKCTLYRLSRSQLLLRNSSTTQGILLGEY